MLIYQLLLIKLNFKIYLRPKGGERCLGAAAGGAPPSCAGRPNPGARGPGARRRAAALTRRDAGGGAGGRRRGGASGRRHGGASERGAGRGINRRWLPPAHPAVGSRPTAAHRAGLLPPIQPALCTYRRMDRRYLASAGWTGGWVKFLQKKFGIYFW